MAQVVDMLKAVPLMGFVLVVYFLVAIGGTGELEKTLLSGSAPSGAKWSLKISDIIIGLGLLVMFVEMLKSTRASVATMIDQGLSMLLFGLCIVLFLLVRTAGTGTFMLLTFMSLVDVLAGFVITTAANRRDINIERSM